MSSKQSIVHGRILLSTESLNKARDHISSLNESNNYLKTSMFGGLEVNYGSSPTCTYDGVIITFGASYKFIQYSWTEYIREFESILRNIDFENASIKLETGLEGTYDFFWKNKTEQDNTSIDDKFIETDLWYFGYGSRNRWGQLLYLENDASIFSFEGFTYPINDLPTSINKLSKMNLKIIKSLRK